MAKVILKSFGVWEYAFEQRELWIITIEEGKNTAKFGGRVGNEFV